MLGDDQTPDTTRSSEMDVIADNPGTARVNAASRGECDRGRPRIHIIQRDLNDAASAGDDVSLRRLHGDVARGVSRAGV